MTIAEFFTRQIPANFTGDIEVMYPKKVISCGEILTFVGRDKLVEIVAVRGRPAHCFRDYACTEEYGAIWVTGNCEVVE